MAEKVGDPVEKDELFLEIGTDKVDSEIPSPASGTVSKLLANPNDIVEVGRVIARIDTDENSKQTDKIETKKRNPIIEKVETVIEKSLPPSPSGPVEKNQKKVKKAHFCLDKALTLLYNS